LATVNQAGGNITIINQGVSEDTIRQLINEKAVSANAQLAARYPKGYVIVGIANGKIIYDSKEAPPNLIIDWKSADVKIDSNTGAMTAYIPNLAFEGSEASDLLIDFPYGDAAVKPLVNFQGNKLYGEILDQEKRIFVLGMR
jgi:hypothetical protein